MVGDPQPLRPISMARRGLWQSMRLSKIKLAGFKSFVDPVVIQLPGPLVGVVGPNGCGKSNIIDAVRWVMGESSAKHLRGEAMADVIFNGCATRKPVGQASVELLFDNSDGSLGGHYAQYAEISIRRQVTRDGSSNYFLNGARCRRRDIMDIFLGTGLGPRSYAIIEQGMISRLIEAKPDELRALLEEAAGISKYKERRRETEGRIAQTRENLARLCDVREELAKQLGHLQRQAKTAEKYTRLRAEQRQLQAETAALHWRTHEQQVQAITAQLAAQEPQLQQAQAALQALDAQLERARLQQPQAQTHFNRLQGDFYALEAELAQVEQAQRHAQEQTQRVRREQAELTAEQQQLSAEQAQDETRLQQAQTQQAALTPQLEQARAQVNQAQQSLMQAEQAHASWREAVVERQRELEACRHALRLEETQQRHVRERLAEAEQRRDRLQAEQVQLVLQPLQAELGQLEQRDQLLTARHTELAQQAAQAATDLQQLREHLHGQTATLAELRAQSHAQQGRLSSLQTLQQAALQAQSGQAPAWLARQGHADPMRLLHELEVNPGWERAVETVLAAALEGFCIPDLEGLLPTLGQLPEGALTLVERDGGMVQGAPETLAAQVRGPVAVAEWLMCVRIAPDLAAAQALRATLTSGQSVITPEGIWLGRGWVRVHKQVRDDGMLARAREIRKLEAELAQQTERVAVQQAELEALRQAQTEQERRREQALAQAQQAQRASHENLTRLEGLRQRLTHGQERAQRIARELDEQTQLIQGLRQTLALNAARLADWQQQVDAQAQAKLALDDQRTTFEASIAQARLAVREGSQHQQSLAVQLEAAVNQARHAEEQRLRLQGRQERLAQRALDLQAQLMALLAPLPALQEKQASLLEGRRQLEAQLAQARARIATLDEELRELQRQHDGQQRTVEGLREATTGMRLQLAAESAQRQRWVEQLAETNLAAAELAAQLPAAADRAEWEMRLHQLGEQIGRLGAVNLTALEECQALAERKHFLDQQDADLNEALTTLEQAMARIDRETRTRFQDTFGRLNAGLQQMFPRLFGGGHAYLELTGDEWLAAGVTIMARPPGKRNSNIQMLSGGEKALTAVALVFAIFELNPAPFCLLDEVDAPLDEANVGRFCALVQEMSAQVQFIFITHNKATMELSSQLLGVTQHELGVSRIVAVDVAEAMQLASVER